MDPIFPRDYVNIQDVRDNKVELNSAWQIDFLQQVTFILQISSCMVFENISNFTMICLNIFLMLKMLTHIIVNVRRWNISDDTLLIIKYSSTGFFMFMLRIYIQSVS